MVTMSRVAKTYTFLQTHTDIIAANPVEKHEAVWTTVALDYAYKLRKNNANTTVEISSYSDCADLYNIMLRVKHYLFIYMDGTNVDEETLEGYINVLYDNLEALYRFVKRDGFFKTKEEEEQCLDVNIPVLEHYANIELVLDMMGARGKFATLGAAVEFAASHAELGAKADLMKVYELQKDYKKTRTEFEGLCIDYRNALYALMITEKVDKELDILNALVTELEGNIGTYVEAFLRCSREL